MPNQMQLGSTLARLWSDFESNVELNRSCQMQNRLKLGIQTRAARGFAIPSSCGGLGTFGAWPPVAAITDQVARFARHFLSAEQPKMNALKLSIQQM